MRTPERAGRAPPLVAAAREAVLRASSSVSRSDRNFTAYLVRLLSLQS
jgi:hypothetical protein